MKILKEVENLRSAIGSGKAYIYTRKGYGKLDSLSVLPKEADEVMVCQNLEHAKKFLGNKKTPPVIVIQGPMNVLWALPIIEKDGEPYVVHGMHGGSYINSSNSLVMDKYLHPIRLMDRVEK